MTPEVGIEVARTHEEPANLCEQLGCDLVVGGRSQADGLGTATGLVAERGMTLVHPFDDREVIAGQGTIGREIVEQAATIAERSLTLAFVPEDLEGAVDPEAAGGPRIVSSFSVPIG